MSFPSYPNPARRARILEAQQLRMQALTMRQIAERMHCSVSTVHAYLRDYELFHADLVQELAADQIVANLIHLGDHDDPHPDQPLAFLPGPSRTEPNTTEQQHNRGPTSVAPRPDAGPRASNSASRTESPSPPPTPNDEAEPARTNPNKPEQESQQNPAHSGISADQHQKSLAQAEQPEQPQTNPVPDNIRAILERSDRDRITDCHPHSPSHPLRLAAIQLKKEAEARKIGDAA